MSTTPPPPPLQHFRIIKTISHSPDIRTTLCLPRELVEPIDIASSPLLASIHSCGTSKLLFDHLGFIPQLVLVHTATSSTTVRSIFKDVAVSRSRSSQISLLASESWACEVPIFGASLLDFCQQYTIANNGAGVPSWFLAHIFHELVHAMCDSGAKKEMSVENVRLNIHPGEDEEEEYVFRSYPSIILDTATAAPAPFPDAFARDVAELIRSVVFEWSDSAPFIKAAGPVMETTDPLLLIMGEMGTMLNSATPFWVQDLRARFADRLADIRLTGPERMPWHIAKHVHADLVTGWEMERAMKGAMVIKFEKRYEEFLRLDAGEEVRMGEGGHAGMRTGRIMVVKFGDRKGDWLSAVGQVVEEEAEEEEAEEEEAEEEDVVMVDIPRPQGRRV